MIRFIYIYIYITTKLFKFQILFNFLILLKEIIMIIKTYHKVTHDITQIVDRHIQNSNA